MAFSGIAGPYSIPAGLTRQELQERFGTPVSSTTAETGRQMEVFHVRRQLHDREHILVEEVACFAFVPCLFFWPILFAQTVIKSQAERVDIAIVYGPDDRSLYYYRLDVDPPTHYLQVSEILVHPIIDASGFEKCESISACMTEHVVESRRRAAETGYELNADTEIRFRRQVEIAHEIDNHKITRDEAIEELQSLQTSR